MAGDLFPELVAANESAIAFDILIDNLEDSEVLVTKAESSLLAEYCRYWAPQVESRAAALAQASHLTRIARLIGELMVSRAETPSGI